MIVLYLMWFIPTSAQGVPSCESALIDTATLLKDTQLFGKYFLSDFGILINMYWKKRGKN